MFGDKVDVLEEPDEYPSDAHPRLHMVKSHQNITLNLKFTLHFQLTTALTELRECDTAPPQAGVLFNVVETSWYRTHTNDHSVESIDDSQERRTSTRTSSRLAPTAKEDECTRAGRLPAVLRYVNLLTKSLSDLTHIHA